MYYVGTLAKNQKRFDSCQGGKPFKFRLNQGEVIKGWDNGVNGKEITWQVLKNYCYHHNNDTIVTDV